MNEHYIIIGKGRKMPLGYLPIKGNELECDGNKVFLHREVYRVTKSGKISPRGSYYKEGLEYCVSCIKTGFKAYLSFKPTNKGVIADFMAFMGETFPNKKHKNFKSAIDEMIKEHGLTPEFDKSKERLILKDKLLTDNILE